MAESVTKIIDVITTVLVAVIVTFALGIVVGKPFGIHAYAVLSGSMEPEYHTGSLIYVKEVEPSTLGQGDVITFMTGKDATVTHRIVSEVEGEDGVIRFETKGDANVTADGDLVHPDNIIGTPMLQIPTLGYVVNFIQFPPGTYIAISVCAIAVFFMFLPDLFPSRKDEEDEEETEERPRRQKSPQGRDRYAIHQSQPQYAKAACRPAKAPRPRSALPAAEQQQASVQQRPASMSNNPRFAQARTARSTNCVVAQPRNCANSSVQRFGQPASRPAQPAVRTGQKTARSTQVASCQAQSAARADRPVNRATQQASPSTQRPSVRRSKR